VAKLGYWVDLDQVDLSEAKGSWVHALSVGAFEHPAYGKVDVSSSRLQRFADSVKNKVRGIDPSINYDHTDGEAAGWVKDSQIRDTGLWIFVEWTAKAAAQIKERAYRYFSSEFLDEWKDPKSQNVFTDVFIGGALTNRPFLKDLVPVNLSELVGNPAGPPEQGKEGEGMDPKKLREILKLSETATDDEVTAALTKLSESAGTGQPSTPPPPTPPAPPAPPAGTGDVDPKDVTTLLSELVDTSNNPAVKALGELVKTQQEELTRLHTANREAAVEKKLSELDDIAKDRDIAIPTSVHDQLKHILLNSPVKLGEMVFNSYVDTIKLGVVELGERGWQRRVHAGTPGQRFEELVGEQIKLSEGKMNYADAMERVAAQNPQLYTEYREESFAGRE
jgi:hypothetical protein